MKFIDKLLDMIYEKRKRNIALIFLFGFILRLIAAKNLGVSADDANHAIRQIGIFNSEKLAIWDQSTALWYYIEGVFYNLFGSSMTTTRFATVVFGSFLILVVYLFVKKSFKSEKAALISSFLVALSPILIKETLPEMDIAASFFTLFAAYFLFSYLEDKKKKDLFFMSVLLGVGIMIKLYVAFFAISFIIFLAVMEFRNHKSYKKTFNLIFFIGIIIFILCLPTFTHNYLLYKDKGFTDLIFTNTFHLGEDKAKEFYGWGAGWMPHSDYMGFFTGNQKNFDPTPIPGFLIVLGMLFKGDPILFILGILGLILSYKYHKKYFWFFILTFIPTFIYLGAQIPMAKHFIWALVLISPFAGVFSEKILSNMPKVRLRHLLLLILIFNLFYLGMPKDISPTNAHFYGQSSFGQLVDYKSGIPKDALVIVDSRIYRGNIHFALAGTNFIEATQFLQAMSQLSSSENLQNIDIYYVECVIDDCGWGTVSSQPEFNKSMEELTSQIAKISRTNIDFQSPDPYKISLPFYKTQRVDYRLYKAQIALDPRIFQIAKQTHIWWSYPENYDRSISEIFDDYYTYNAFDTLLNKLAWLILYIEIVLSFVAIIYIGYTFIQD